MTYLLKEKTPYFGMQMPQAEGMFMGTGYGQKT